MQLVITGNYIPVRPRGIGYSANDKKNDSALNNKAIIIKPQAL